MKLFGPDGSSIALRLVGYELEYPVDDEYDANRLQVRIDVTTPAGAWSATAACMTTWEVEHVASWLEGIAKGKTDESVLEFVEPHLLFRLRVDDDRPVALRIHFADSFLPPWKPDKRMGEEDPWVEVPVSEIALRAASRDLLERLRRFPPRGTA